MLTNKRLTHQPITRKIIVCKTLNLISFYTFFSMKKNSQRLPTQMPSSPPPPPPLLHAGHRRQLPGNFQISLETCRRRRNHHPLPLGVVARPLPSGRGWPSGHPQIPRVATQPGSSHLNSGTPRSQGWPRSSVAATSIPAWGNSGGGGGGGGFWAEMVFFFKTKRVKLMV
jgi:hypothetical protein